MIYHIFLNRWLGLTFLISCSSSSCPGVRWKGLHSICLVSYGEDSEVVWIRRNVARKDTFRWGYRADAQRALLTLPCLRIDFCCRSSSMGKEQWERGKRRPSHLNSQVLVVSFASVGSSAGGSWNDGDRGDDMHGPLLFCLLFQEGAWRNWKGRTSGFNVTDLFLQHSLFVNRLSCPGIVMQSIILALKKAEAGGLQVQGYPTPKRIWTALIRLRVININF